jgi:hypothetical protein
MLPHTLEGAPSNLNLHRHLDIEQATTLDSLTTRLATLSGEGDPTYPTEIDYYDCPSDVRYGRSKQGSSGSIASIANSLARIETRMDGWMGPSVSRHGSQSGSVGSLGSTGMSYSSEHNEFSASEAHSRGHRKSRYGHYPTRWSDWEWIEQYQREARYREISNGV